MTSDDLPILGALAIGWLTGAGTIDNLGPVWSLVMLIGLMLFPLVMIGVEWFKEKWKEG